MLETLRLDGIDFHAAFEERIGLSLQLGELLLPFAVRIGQVLNGSGLGVHFVGIRLGGQNDRRLVRYPHRISESRSYIPPDAPGFTHTAESGRLILRPADKVERIPGIRDVPGLEGCARSLAPTLT